MRSDMINVDFKIAQCRIINGFNKNIYNFRLYDTYSEIIAGDVVVVDANGEFKLAEIVEIIPQSDWKDVLPYKDVVASISMIEYQNYIKRKEYKKEYDKIKSKRKKLKQQMNQILHDDADLTIYHMMAEKNPQMKELLDEYESLNIEVAE